MLNAAIIITAAVIGAVLSRWHGGGILQIEVPKAYKSMIYAVPFAAFSYLETQNLYIVFAAFVLCSLGKSMGHGGFFDLGHWDKPRDDERLEFMIKWLKPYLPEYWYDALGMALKGLCEVSGAIVANPIMAFAGLLKGPCYMAGWKFSPNKPTEFGEYASGAVQYGFLAALVVL